MDLLPGKMPYWMQMGLQSKLKSNGSTEQFKARLLIAKRLTQQAQIDYRDTFSSIVKMVNVRS